MMRHFATPLKVALLAAIVLATQLAPAAQRPSSPQLALNTDGTLAITDGCSYYVFSRDGTFHSFPNTISGRCLDGTFTSDGGDVATFTVTAEQTWLNGLSPSDDYRKVVFRVYPGSNRKDENGLGGGMPAPKMIWDGYYYIDEMTKIPKPAK